MTKVNVETLFCYSFHSQFLQSRNMVSFKQRMAAEQTMESFSTQFYFGRLDLISEDTLEEILLTAPIIYSICFRHGFLLCLLSSECTQMSLQLCVMVEIESLQALDVYHML